MSIKIIFNVEETKDPELGGLFTDGTEVYILCMVITNYVVVRLDGVAVRWCSDKNEAVEGLKPLPKGSSVHLEVIE